MIIQKCVKGIAGGGAAGITREQAFGLVRHSTGIFANRWRNFGGFKPDEIAKELTDHQLDRHLHDYTRFGPISPFISLASGSVKRSALVRRNQIYSAIDTALLFATDNWTRPGALFFCWVLTGVNLAVENHIVAESVRDLLIYRRWSRYQLEGEVTAKVWIPANQIERVEWWDGSSSTVNPQVSFPDVHYVDPAQLGNIRELF
ncbi:hypothetical protein [Pararobbsia alpina]|uniref:Uncharacterized protein n=1 Tax=Pararobbsia alpina TaxID=621374 RepID=A0A6S7BMT5_9BURK|nr:hypothetical protein [Pararobbsia alpina]CAB3805627.1 hypothetical protein LMG28138_05697 [Pararobbsia alpina]